MAYTYTYKKIYVFWFENDKINTKEIIIEIPNWKKENHLSASYKHYTQGEVLEIIDFFHRVFRLYPTIDDENTICCLSDFCDGNDITKYAMWSYSNDIELFKEKMREKIEKDIWRIERELEAKHKKLAIIQ